MLTTLFAARIKRERPRIEAALEQAVQDLAKPVQPVAAHILRAGGKRLRPLLAVFTARLLGCQSDDIYPLAATLELVHAATLLHDDVLDNAPTRRGQASAHSIFGITRAILGGDALLARAGVILSAYGDPRLMDCFSQTVEQTATGQILELDRQEHPTPDLEQYIDVIRGKTAWMIRAACECGALRAKASPERLRAAAEYGLNVGIAFQIIDDALDFAPSAQTGKPEGGDIREGKLTPPVHVYLRDMAEDKRQDFITRFATRSLDENEIKHVVATVRERKFDTQARDMADEYLNAAREQLAQLLAPGEDFPHGLRGEEARMLEAVLGYVRDRKA